MSRQFEKREIKDFVQIYENAISSTLCNDLRNIVDGENTERIDVGWRRCTTARLTGLKLSEFKKEIKNLYKKYCSLTSTLNPCHALESPKIIRYDPGEQKDHFRQHADAWDVMTSTRVVSVIAYLNDVKKGGETIFPHFDISISPKRGSLLLFPASFVYLHLAKPPESEPKYIVVSWMHFADQNVHLRTSPLHED